MKDVLTFTLIAGTKACPNNCPICISKQTPSHGIEYEKIPINIPCFQKSIQIALNHRAQNVLITGKGEPTLFPSQVSQYLIELKDKPFDKRELQTEGFNLSNSKMDEFLEIWKMLDLDFIAVSIYHYDSKFNQQMFKNEKGYEINKLLVKLNNMGFKIRLSCVLAKGYMDSVLKIQQLIDFSIHFNITQLSLRTIDNPKYLSEIQKYQFDTTDIENYIKNGIFCDSLPHGASIYEVDGQNVCLTSGLTNDAGKDNIRQLIFFPQGILTSSWISVNGSRIL